MSYSKTGIKSWSVSDQPREKYKRLGGQKLTDAELLAIVIANGFQGQSALLLAKTILETTGHSLHTLFEMPVERLMEFKGIGLAKAIQIKAALDMGHRSVSLGPAHRKSIASSAAAYGQFKGVLTGLAHEEFWMLYLNNANEVLELSVVGRGGFTATLVDIRLLLRKAIQLGAIGLIAAHNHPSGVLRPSEQDKKLTEKLKTAAASVDIKLLDHLIIGRGEYFSFADQDLL